MADARQVSYARLLQEFPFKGAEGTLKSLEEHEIVSVTYLEGRASKVKPGKPVFRYVFQELCNGASPSVLFSPSRRADHS